MGAGLKISAAIGVLIVTLLGGALALRALLAPSRGPDFADIALGASRLVVPRGYLRFEADAVARRLDRLDLAARAPDFAPPDRAAPAPSAGADQRDERLVFLALTPNDGSLDPAERPAKLYARFLEADVWTHPGGLLMRRFQKGAPYTGEELYIAPPEGRAFWARCPIPGTASDGLPDFCLTELRIEGVDVQMRFSGAQLADWERLAEGARALVRRIAR